MASAELAQRKVKVNIDAFIKIGGWLWLEPFAIVRCTVITKTYLYNFDPLKPHFDIVKLGFTGVYINFFYFCSKS